jgi:glycosyltransferase involved in cell wall biosynthesis
VNPDCNNNNRSTVVPRSQIRQLAPLPFPVNFVFKDNGSWSDLFQQSAYPPSVEDLVNRFGSSPPPNWILQTFIQLKRRGLDVRLQRRPVPGQICVMSLWHIGRRDIMGRSYNVVVQADCCRPAVADHVIVQNPTNVTSEREHLIQHWPQPGLMPRDHSRGDTIRRLVYRGTLANLWPPLQSRDFINLLAELGVDFVYDSMDAHAAKHAEWYDYREADLVLAMRDLTVYDERIKPATKLCNAWLAGVPAILGPESAYQALRRNELDYIEARSVEDVLCAIQRLRANPHLYRAMRERAAERAVEFTPDAISEDWRNTLAGPISDGYRQWLKTPQWKREFKAWSGHVFNYHRHKKALTRYLVDRSKGPGILGSA